MMSPGSYDVDEMFNKNGLGADLSSPNKCKGFMDVQTHSGAPVGNATATPKSRAIASA